MAVAARHRITTACKSRWADIALVAIVIGLSRLPQLTSPQLLLDGDECVLGLMAKHLAEGLELPVFFAGQSYGFSLLEAAAGGLAFATAGLVDVHLKLAMLGLWTAGVVANHRALAHFVGRGPSLWATLLLVTLPAWAVWSMKARGGYLTAFAVAGWLFLTLVRTREHPSVLRWTTAGSLTAVILIAQRLWLPGVLPALAAVWWPQRHQWRWSLSFVGGVAITLTAAKVMSGLSVAQMFSQPRARNMDPLGSVPHLLSQLYTHFTGSYYLWAPVPPGGNTTILAWLSCGLLIALLLVQIYRLFARQFLALSHLLCASVVATILAILVLVVAPEPRFFLPLSALMLAWAAVETADLAPRLRVPSWLLTAALGSCLALGTLSHVEFRGYSYLWDLPVPPGAEIDWIRAVVAQVQRNGARHVFVTNGLLQWQLMFYSGESLVARYTNARDRYQTFVTAVDVALDRGEPVALVGYLRGRGALDATLDPTRVTVIGGRYFVYTNPEKDLLRSLGFRFSSDTR